jgi:transposase
MDADPKTSAAESACPGCVARDRKIAELESRLAKLEALARAGKRQAAPFSKGPPKAEPRTPGRKAGDDYGVHRRRQIPRHIDEVLEAPLPRQCPFCSGSVQEIEIAPQYQTEIPRKVIVRQFNVHVGQCDCCKKRVQGRHALQTSDALGACASQIGPDAQALATQLNKDAGLSWGKVSRFFNAAFELDLSRSGACRTMLRVARRCEPAYHAIVQCVRRSPAIVPDETGWRLGGLPAWLHAAVGDAATAYLVHRRRGYDAAVQLIGPDYEGFLTHDGWAPYMRFILACHQTCLAHLLRRAHELEEAAPGKAVRFPRQIKAVLKESLAVRNARDAGVLTATEAGERGEQFSSRMQELTWRPRANTDNERFAGHLYRQQQQGTLFTFLSFENVDATNYKAEQAIRPATVNRKVWGGNRTEAGAVAQSVLMSVLRTAAQRGIDVVNYLSSTLKARLGSAPQLVPDS